MSRTAATLAFAASGLAFVTPTQNGQKTAGSLRASRAAPQSTSAPSLLGMAGARVARMISSRAAVAVSAFSVASMNRSTRKSSQTARQVVGVCLPLTDKFDPLELSSTDAKMERYTAVEIKHGRAPWRTNGVAMIATMGYIMPELFRFPGCESFKHGLGALESIPLEGWVQLELERKQTSERNNGRLAMIAIMGLMVQDGMFGEPPLTYMSKNGWWGEPVQFFVQHINNCQSFDGSPIQNGSICALPGRTARTQRRAVQKLSEGPYVETETYPKEMEMSAAVPFLRYPQASCFKPPLQL
eukprot:Skav212657  [mRNA]  locus=scaffold1227:196379:201782:+ [translate_table: standard]